jgi:hypothetical protein
LHTKNFQSLYFLGINWNVKKEWRTHRAFGGIGLFSFTVENTIRMINIFIQHSGAETTLAKKFSGSLEALQLDIGCLGNPLKKKINKLHLFATLCWTKSFW